MSTKTKIEIGQRLRTVADELGGPKKLADILKMRPQGLYGYFNGKSMVGGSLLIRLDEHGLNPRWILTGKGAIWNTEITDQISITISETVKAVTEANKRLVRDTTAAVDTLIEQLKGVRQCN